MIPSQPGGGSVNMGPPRGPMSLPPGGGGPQPPQQQQHLSNPLPIRGGASSPMMRGPPPRPTMAPNAPQQQFMPRGVQPQIIPQGYPAGPAPPSTSVGQPAVRPPGAMQGPPPPRPPPTAGYSNGHPAILGTPPPQARPPQQMSNGAPGAVMGPPRPAMQPPQQQQQQGQPRPPFSNMQPPPSSTTIAGNMGPPRPMGAATSAPMGPPPPRGPVGFQPGQPGARPMGGPQPPATPASTASSGFGTAGMQTPRPASPSMNYPPRPGGMQQQTPGPRPLSGVQPPFSQPTQQQPPRQPQMMMPPSPRNSMMMMPPGQAPRGGGNFAPPGQQPLGPRGPNIVPGGGAPMPMTMPGAAAGMGPRPPPSMMPGSAAGPRPPFYQQQQQPQPQHQQIPQAPPQMNRAPQQQQTRTPRPSLEQLTQPITFQTSMQDGHSNCLLPFPSPFQDPYVGIDNGQANCRFMRPTSRLLACSSQLVEEMKFPLAILCTPFADLQPGEVNPVPLSEWTHEQGPIRCTRCKGYLNCFIRANSDFSQWECSLCGHANDTPVHYRSFAQGAQVPELRFGSVEFEVPLQFFGDRLLAREDYCFVVDSTAPSMKSGLFTFSLRTILNLCRTRSFASANSARIGILTYDEQSVQFYELHSGNGMGKPRILISGDCEEGFSPLPASAFMVPCQDLERVDEMIQFILASAGSSTNNNENTTSNIGGAAVMSAYSALKDTGGRIIWFCSSMPTRGQGKLLDREQPPLVGTDQEQQLYTADKEEKFYNELSLKCLNSSIAVDVLVCGSYFVDAAALVQMPSTTGGVFERIPRFQAMVPSDRAKLEAVLLQIVQTPRAMSCMMKARTSGGLRVTRYVGHGFPEETSFRISSMSSDYCLAIELEHDGTKLEDGKSRGVVQLAILYVNSEGKRRLRVHNLAMQAKESPAILLQNGYDPITIVSYWGKLVSLELAESTVIKARDALVRRVLECVRTLSKHSPPRRQEPLELMILYVLSLLKQPALLLNRPLDRGVREPYARADARIDSRFKLLWMSPEKFAQKMYPALYDLSDPSQYGDPMPIVAPSIAALPPSNAPNSELQTLRLPPRYPASSEFLRAEGVFLLDDGSSELDLFIGSRAPPQFVEQLLGSLPSVEVKSGMIRPNSGSVYRICRQLLKDRHALMAQPGESSIPVQISNGATAEFFNENKHFLAKLVEDKIYAEQSYGSFVTHVYQLLDSTRN